MTARLITREQREALKEVFSRCAVYPPITSEERAAGIVPVALTYKQFRRGVEPTIGCDGAVVVHWCGMWLCIERDGYCHS